MSDNSYLREENERLKREIHRMKYSCPDCGCDRTTIVGYPDYRFSHFGEYTVQCNKCGSIFGVSDDATG